MAEQKKNKQEETQEKVAREKRDQKQATKEEKKDRRNVDDEHETLIRIFGYDLPGSKGIYPAFTRIKGVSWAISNVICLKLNFPRNKKVSELTKQDIQKIEAFLKNIDIYDFMKNRRADVETGKTAHVYGSDLDITKDFDIKRQKKIRSYVGMRHAQGQPVRGQRTRSHFRKKKIVKAGKKAAKKV